MRGTGKPLRQFIFSQDLAKLILKVLFNYNKKESIILSPGPESEVSIKDISFIIAKNFSYEEKLVFDSSFSDGQYKKTVDNVGLKNTYPNFIFTPIEDGLKKSINWFKQNYSTARK